MALQGVNSVPLSGVIQAAVSLEGLKATYSVAGTQVLAATPTDVVVLQGIAGKTIRVNLVEVSGVAATALQNIPVLLVKRSVADTGGTATTPAPVPHDSLDPAASAVLSQFSANPTVGTSLGTVREADVAFVLATGTNASSKSWSFGDRNDRAIVLRGAAESLCINLAGVTLTNATTIFYSIEWTEE